MTSDNKHYEVIAKPLGARASRPQVLENAGKIPVFPAKTEGFAITSYVNFLGLTNRTQAAADHQNIDSMPEF
jgi:hypothetical protein